MKVFRILLILAVFLSISMTANADFQKYRYTVRLVAVGDIMLGRGVAGRVNKNGTDWVFENVKPVLSQADLLFANLESPLAEKSSPDAIGFAFKGNPLMADELAACGFDVLSLANNHGYDQGRLTLRNTLELLRSKGIKTVGAGIEPDEPYDPVIVDIYKTKIAFIAAQDVISFKPIDGKAGVAFINKKRIISEIQKIRDDVDFVIVSLHWGKEYAQHPMDSQIQTARELIDNGADIILGHHPHVIQGMERYKHGFIAYSLGNFVFDQRDERTKRSFILALDLYPDGTISSPMIAPVAIKDFRPVLDTSPSSDKTITELISYGSRFGANGITSFTMLSTGDVVPPLKQQLHK